MDIASSVNPQVRLCDLYFIHNIFISFLYVYYIRFKCVLYSISDNHKTAVFEAWVDRCIASQIRTKTFVSSLGQPFCTEIEYLFYVGDKLTNRSCVVMITRQAVCKRRFAPSAGSKALRCLLPTRGHGAAVAHTAAIPTGADIQSIM